MRSRVPREAQLWTKWMGVGEAIIAGIVELKIVNGAVNLSGDFIRYLAGENRVFVRVKEGILLS